MSREILKMHETFSVLLDRLVDGSVCPENVIGWGAPVPSFGDVTRAKVATLGLNPSNREFMDITGNELDGNHRRFYTLNSLGLTTWSEASVDHIRLIVESCLSYFRKNPYDLWFRTLDSLLSGIRASYYGTSTRACHLDLVPYATYRKWAALTTTERSTLLQASGDTLGMVLRASPVRYLVLNGRTVVDTFKEISDVSLSRREMPTWTLPRVGGEGVKGYSYFGTVREVAGVRLPRDIVVLGFNHNIQSSFGVTNKVKSSIRTWIGRKVNQASA